MDVSVGVTSARGNRPRGPSAGASSLGSKARAASEDSTGQRSARPSTPSPTDAGSAGGGGGSVHSTQGNRPRGPSTGGRSRGSKARGASEDSTGDASVRSGRGTAHSVGDAGGGAGVVDVTNPLNGHAFGTDAPAV